MTIDATAVGEPFERVWASFGYDELNWTATPRGRANMSTLRTIFGDPAVVRAHNLLTSGNGRGLPHWSSGNVYHEDAHGRQVYDWGQIDPVFDVWVDNDMVPLVELGFCPVQLSRPLTRTSTRCPPPTASMRIGAGHRRRRTCNAGGASWRPWWATLPDVMARRGCLGGTGSCGTNPISATGKGVLTILPSVRCNGGSSAKVVARGTVGRAGQTDRGGEFLARFLNTA